jgi:hypothetical protein
LALIINKLRTGIYHKTAQITHEAACGLLISALEAATFASSNEFIALPQKELHQPQLTNNALRAPKSETINIWSRGFPIS